MKSALILLAALFLASCSGSERAPFTVECSVDDTLVFVAPGATQLWNDGPTITVRSNEGDLVRHMQPNETCRAVSP